MISVNRAAKQLDVQASMLNPCTPFDPRRASCTFFTVSVVAEKPRQDQVDLLRKNSSNIDEHGIVPKMKSLVSAVP